MTKEKGLDTTMIMIVLLSINVLLLLYVSFFKKDAMWLETMKVWWAANMNSVIQLYNSQEYKDSQTQTIQQVMASIQTQEQAQVQQMPTQEVQVEQPELVETAE